jgi:hypothetical protein
MKLCSTVGDLVIAVVRFDASTGPAARGLVVPACN